jgi:hypothetical protein
MSALQPSGQASRTPGGLDRSRGRAAIRTEHHRSRSPGRSPIPGAQQPGGAAGCRPRAAGCLGWAGPGRCGLLANGRARHQRQEHQAGHLIGVETNHVVLGPQPSSELGPPRPGTVAASSTTTPTSRVTCPHRSTLFLLQSTAAMVAEPEEHTDDPGAAEVLARQTRLCRRQVSPSPCLIPS